MHGSGGAYTAAGSAAVRQGRSRDKNLRSVRIIGLSAKPAPKMALRVIVSFEAWSFYIALP